MSLRALLILLPLSLAACGGGGTSAPPADAGQAPPAKVKEAAPPPTAKADAKDPCTLLSVAEVETALGGRLAGPPYRVMARASGGDGNEGKPNDRGDFCRYELVGGRNIELSYVAKGGPLVLRFLGGVQGMTDKLAKGIGVEKGSVGFSSGATLRGDWDEARVGGCCTLYALVGEGLVTLDAEGFGPMQETVGQLVNLALGRLDARLPIDGRAGNAPAAARHAARTPPHEDPCALTSAEKAAAIWGATSAGPVRRKSWCVLKVPYAGSEQEIEYRIEPRDGFAGFYGRVGSAKGIVGKAANTTPSLRVEVPTDVGDAAYLGPAGLFAVKQDVLIEMQKVQIHDPEKAKAFMRELLAALP